MTGEQTLGQQRVRVSFNPEKHNLVDLLKQKTAELIDMVDNIKHLDPRLAAIAQTQFEMGAMFAVKLATTPVPITEDQTF